MLRIIQIRIPKTATTSIEAALKFMRNKNLLTFKSHGHGKSPAIFRQYTEEQRKKSIVLASARNPYDRLVSAYQYIIQFKGDKRDKELKYVFDYPTFKDFAMDIPNIFEKNQFFHPHVAWLYSGDAKLYDFIIRYETLSEDWDRFTQKLNLPHLELPTQRKTKRSGWQSYYDKESTKVVYKLYKEDFKRLEYEI